MPQRTVLELTGGTDNGPLSVSLHGLGISAQQGNQAPRHLDAKWLEVIHESRDLLDVSTREGIADNGQRGCTTQRQDRKSTRLNSSHLVISYAVFCLKKKKAKDNI